MTTPQDLLSKSQTTMTVALHKYYLLKVQKEDELFCFVEGIDDSYYYYPRIKNHSNHKAHFISCGNKRNVININNKLLNIDFDKNKLAFFIDHDFDKQLNNDTIFETPCYSIENLYCTEEVFCDILKTEFNLTEIDNQYKKILEKFKKNQRTFHGAILCLNAWYATIKSKTSEIKFCLGTNIPKELINIKIDNIEKKYDLEMLLATYPTDDIIIHKHEILGTSKTLIKMNPTYSFRGKYEIDYVCTFLQEIIEDANNKSKQTMLKSKTKFRIDKSLVLSHLSQYAETPESLILYINKFN